MIKSFIYDYNVIFVKNSLKLEVIWGDLISDNFIRFRVIVFYCYMGNYSIDIGGFINCFSIFW